MILTRKDLQLYIKEDAKRNGCNVNCLKFYLMLLAKSENALAYRYLKILRLAEFHSNQTGIWHKLMAIYYRFRKRRIGSKYHIHIPLNKTGYGLRIMHLSGGWYLTEYQ